MEKHAPDKKVLRLEIKNQLAQSLGHLKELWGEKKFNNKVDDAVKLFTKGIGKIESSKEVSKEDKKEQNRVGGKETTDKKISKKEAKKGAKKEVGTVSEVRAAPKKQAPQKTARKSAVKSGKY